MEKIFDADMEMLYEAAKRGCVATLNTLIQKDKLILNRVSLTSFPETPLHISSLLGHIDFTLTLLRLYPKMVVKLDSFRCSPLHLASAEGHIEIVKALLSVNVEVCLIRDEGGRIPLHLAAMRGNVEAIRELVSACPESSSQLLDGETVFHLCVRYNNLEALKLLEKMVNEDQLVNRGNQDGNTILHIAVMLKQVETIRFLVSVPRIRAAVDKLNNMEFTALDVLEKCHKDFKNLEIREFLMRTGARAGAGGSPRRDDRIQMTQPAAPATVSRRPSTQKELLNKYKRFIQLQDNWIEETQGTLMTVATLIATITFQAAMNPPGGVWQADDNKSSYCNSTDVCFAGTAVSAYALPADHTLFMTYNTISFAASLVVIFLIISGFPLRNRLVTWFLTVAMSTTLVFMASTYVVSLDMVTPDSILHRLYWVKKVSIFVWLGAVALVSLVQMLRLCLWTSKKSRKVYRGRKIWRMKKLQKLEKKLQNTPEAGQNPLARV